MAGVEVRVTVRSSRGRHLKFMRIGVVFAVLMQSFVAPIASAIKIDVRPLHQDLPAIGAKTSTEERDKNVLGHGATKNPTTPDSVTILQTEEANVSSSDSVDEKSPGVPTADPLAGIYNKDLAVKLSASDSISIYYTTDGSEPDRTSLASKQYNDSEPISITKDTTVKAIAYGIAGRTTKAEPFLYTIDKNPPVIEKVEYIPEGTATKEIKVKITVSEAVTRPDDTWSSEGTSETIFTKTYIEDAVETITVKDFATNESERKEIIVEGIDSAKPSTGFSSFELSPLSTSPVIRPLSTSSMIATPNAASSAFSLTTATPELLRVRAEAANASLPAITDTSLGKDIPLAPSGEGWKLWGIAWYWYGGTAGLLGAGWWLVGRKYFAIGKDEL